MSEDAFKNGFEAGWFAHSSGRMCSLEHELIEALKDFSWECAPESQKSEPVSDPCKLELEALAKEAAERVHENGGCVPQLAYAPILFALQANEPILQAVMNAAQPLSNPQQLPEASKVEQEPINSALAAYGALWCMVTDNPTLHAARKHLLASIGGQGSKAQRLAITWAVRNVAHPTDAEIAAMDFHPAPASDELLKAIDMDDFNIVGEWIERGEKGSAPSGRVKGLWQSMRRVVDIAKHKGPQS